MAASVIETSKKIVLDLSEGTQTVSPVLESATDEQIYATGDAVTALIQETCEMVKLVVVESIA